MSPAGQDRPGVSGLTIREVAARTGVEAATLRMWEQRHGFPVPERLPSGHRRYSQTHVELIRQVMRDRESGLSLKAAIDNVRRAAAGDRPAVSDDSVYAGLRRRRPDIAPYLLTKRTLVGVSHAIEDECCARALRPLLIASFQRERFYRQAESRWRELSSTAEVAFVMADFPRLREPQGAPVEVPIPGADPAAREWALICDAPAFSALLVGWERPGQASTPDPERSFETVWSVEAELVRDAAHVACAIAERSAPDATAGAERVLERPVGIHEDRVRLLEALTNRMIAYVGSGAEVTPLPAPHSSAGG